MPIRKLEVRSLDLQTFLELRDQILRRRFRFHIRHAGIEKLTGDAVGFAMLLQLHAEVGGMRRIFLDLPQGWRATVKKVDGWIIGGHERIGRVFSDPWQDFFPSGHEVVEVLELASLAEGMATILAVRRPLTHLLRI